MDDGDGEKHIAVGCTSGWSTLGIIADHGFELHSPLESTFLQQHPSSSLASIWGTGAATRK